VSFIVCAFYTANTPYYDIFKSYLEPTLLNLGLEHDVTAIETLGNWNKNTSYKPTLALNMLEKHSGKDIVIVDVDARIESYPTLFTSIPETYNFGVRLLDRAKVLGHSNLTKELLTGTMFIRNNERSKEIVTNWKDECSKSSSWEQLVLHGVLKRSNEPIYALPSEYCWIDILPNGCKSVCNGKVVVRHFQASRTTKKAVWTRP
jgi:hypothetical protein